MGGAGRGCTGSRGWRGRKELLLPRGCSRSAPRPRPRCRRCGCGCCVSVPDQPRAPSPASYGRAPRLPVRGAHPDGGVGGQAGGCGGPRCCCQCTGAPRSEPPFRARWGGRAACCFGGPRRPCACQVRPCHACPCACPGLGRPGRGASGLARRWGDRPCRVGGLGAAAGPPPQDRERLQH